MLEHLEYIYNVNFNEGGSGTTRTNAYWSYFVLSGKYPKRSK